MGAMHKSNPCQFGGVASSRRAGGSILLVISNGWARAMLLLSSCWLRMSFSQIGIFRVVREELAGVCDGVERVDDTRLQPACIRRSGTLRQFVQARQPLTQRLTRFGWIMF